MPPCPATAAAGRSVRGGAKTAPQLRDRHKERVVVTGAAEERRAESSEEEEGEARASGCGAGKDSAEGRYDSRAAGKGAAKSERAGGNKAGVRGASAIEGRGADVGKGFIGVSRAGPCNAGGGEGAANPGVGDRDAIVG